MPLQQQLAMVPLLLSYPTVILSNDLIIPIEAGFRRLLILPFFSATTLTAIACTLKPGFPLRAIFFLWIIAFILFELALLLGPVQATCLFLVTAKLILAVDSDGGRKSRLLNAGKQLVPLPLISIAIAWTGGRNSKILFTPCLVYLTLIAVVLILYPRATVFLKTAKRLKQRQEQEQEHQKQQCGDMPLRGSKYQFSVILLITLTCYLLLYYLSSLQPLMVFVFIGCLVIFFLSLSDVIREEGPEFILQSWIVCAAGILSAVLQYLSFNTVSASIIGDLLTGVFIAICEFTSQRIIGLSSATTPASNNSSNVQSACKHYSHRPHQDHLQERGILSEVAHHPDTRSIFSFLLLNTTFMFVQLLYSFRSKSLGLLSDSLHMALDCTSLLLGLIAGVLSNRPPSDKYPFGLGLLETLAGFMNGVLLLGIVCGIFVQAVSRLINPIAVQETNELLVVAMLGLVVNLFGLMAFDHGGHADDSSNENMRGIFLHILADTLGSVGVILSTVLIKITRLHIFDPIASIFIGSLILLSAIPLLKSTTSSLLLRLDEKKHKLVKNALNQISTTPGITGYTTPRFWPSSSEGCTHSHSHSHSHAHAHTHAHSHSHLQFHPDESDCGQNFGHHDEKNHYALIGYIHVQYVEGENSTIIKKRVENIFEGVGIKAWIQVEPNDSTCWCRAPSSTQTVTLQSKVNL